MACSGMVPRMTSTPRSTACSKPTRVPTTSWPTWSKSRAETLRHRRPGPGFRHPAVRRAGPRLVALLDSRLRLAAEHAAGTGRAARRPCLRWRYPPGAGRLPVQPRPTAAQLLRHLATDQAAGRSRPGRQAPWHRRRRHAGNQPFPVRRALPGRRHRRAARQAAVPLERSRRQQGSRPQGMAQAGQPQPGTAAHRLCLAAPARRCLPLRPAAMPTWLSRPYSLKASVGFPADHARPDAGRHPRRRRPLLRPAGWRNTASACGPNDRRRGLPRHRLAPARRRGRSHRCGRRNRGRAARNRASRKCIFLDHQFPMEFCDDCGAPLFPNREGELVHAEMPEQPATGSQILH